MFSLADAAQLQAALTPLDLTAPSLDSEPLRRYCTHYGLQFDGLPVQHRLGAFTSGGLTLAMQAFVLPPARSRGTVFVLHGLYDHVGLYTHLIRFCLQRGLSVLAFDLPGHGLSAGAPAEVDDFSRYAEAFADMLAQGASLDLPHPWHVVGQSTGCAAVITHLLRHGDAGLGTVDKIVFLAPLVRPAHWAQSVVSFRLLRHWVKSVPRRFMANSHDEAFLKFLEHDDPLQCRVLPVTWVEAMMRYVAVVTSAQGGPRSLRIVQGTADGTVDWRFNTRCLERLFPGTRTHLIEGARHHLVNESPAYREPVFAALGGVLDEPPVPA